MPARTKSDEERYWYRARGVDSTGTIKEWEGNIVSSMGSALSTVRQRSIMWNAKEIYYISVFEYDMDTGELDRSPLLWQSFDGNEPLEPKQLMLPRSEKSSYTYEDRKVRTVVKHYDNADWCDEVDFPACFLTLKPKETENEQSDHRG